MDRPQQYFVYLLASDRTHVHYVGFTNDVVRRLEAHNGGGSLFTAPHRPWRLVVSVQFPTEHRARQFERYLKSGSGRAFAKRHFHESQWPRTRPRGDASLSPNSCTLSAMALNAERVLWTMSAPEADVVCAIGSDCARVMLTVTRGGAELAREGHPDRAAAYERARALRGQYDESVAAETGETRLVMPACVLRPWRLSDAPALAEHANDPSIGRNLRDGFPSPFTAADAERFIAHARSLDPPTRFAIVVDGEAVGSIGFSLHANVERVSAEIGYWLGARARGRGVMTDAVRAVTRYAIAAHSLTRVYAVPYEWNPASFRVLEKAGFVCEGRMRRSAIKDGQVIDQLLYAYVAEPPGDPASARTATSLPPG